MGERADRSKASGPRFAALGHEAASLNSHSLVTDEHKRLDWWESSCSAFIVAIVANVYLGRPGAKAGEEFCMR